MTHNDPVLRLWLRYNIPIVQFSAEGSLMLRAFLRQKPKGCEAFDHKLGPMVGQYLWKSFIWNDGIVQKYGPFLYLIKFGCGNWTC